MKAKNKILSLLGFILLAGLFCMTVLQAEEPQAVDKAPLAASSPIEAQQQYDYYGDTQVIMVKAVSGRMFKHTTHFIDNKISCNTCHDSIFEREYGKAMATRDNYTMETMEQGKYCGVCHRDDATDFKAFNMTDPDSCLKCHDTNMIPQDMVFFVEPVKTVIFDHKSHVDRQLSCHNCHEKVFKSKAGAAEASPETFTMDEMYKGKTCGSCHNGADAFAASTRCTLCHIGVQGQKRLARVGDAGSAGH